LSQDLLRVEGSDAAVSSAWLFFSRLRKERASGRGAPS
jgi:hypothetical protein